MLMASLPPAARLDRRLVDPEKHYPGAPPLDETGRLVDRSELMSGEVGVFLLRENGGFVGEIKSKFRGKISQLYPETPNDDGYVLVLVPKDTPLFTGLTKPFDYVMENHFKHAEDAAILLFGPESIVENDKGDVESLSLASTVEKESTSGPKLVAHDDIWALQSCYGGPDCPNVNGEGTCRNFHEVSNYMGIGKTTEDSQFCH